MDPLNLAANLIAVVDAASSATKGLKNLYNLKGGPDELLQYQNEA